MAVITVMGGLQLALQVVGVDRVCPPVFVSDLALIAVDGIDRSRPVLAGIEVEELYVVPLFVM